MIFIKIGSYINYYSLIDYYYQTYDFICDNETIPLYIIPLLTILIYNKDESSLSRIIHNLYIKKPIAFAIGFLVSFGFSILF